MNMKKKIIKYVLLCFVLLAACNAKILGMSPFGTGLFISMCLVGLNPLILSPIYIAGSFLFSFQPLSLVSSGCVSIVFVALFLINKSKKIPRYIYWIASLLSLIGFLPQITSELVSFLLFITFVPIFIYVGHAFFSPLQKRGVRFKLLDHELICGCLILCVVAMGLMRAEIHYFPVAAMVAVFIMLFAGRIYGPAGAIAVGFCFGIGACINDYQIMWLVYFPLMSLFAAIFIPTPKIITALSTELAYIMVTYFFALPTTHVFLWIAAIFLGGLGYVLIPQKTLAAAKNILCPVYSPTGMRFNINLLRQKAADAIFKTGETFLEMSGYIAGGGGSTTSLADKTEKIRKDICLACGKHCTVSDDDIERLLLISVEKGRANVVDLPSSMLDSCKNNAAMIASAAKIAAEFQKKEQRQSNESYAKSVVSEQLCGIGGILKEMSDKLGSPISYDFERERVLRQELVCHDIYCYDAVIAQDTVTLVVAPEHYEKNLLQKLVSKHFSQRYIVRKEEEGGGGIAVQLSKMPPFDVVFAVASLAKDEVSGDTHSFLKIDDNKFLMALCDGMGSGKTARAFSDSTISLIECFYRAGFESNMVIKSVNRFLSLSSDETFAASDICILDLRYGSVDIFKIGSPPLYIKTQETVKEIEGSSLPIGVIEEIKPSFSKAVLSGGDMLILVSDGVFDCFEEGELVAEISGASDVSPDAACKQILKKAREKSEHQRDDMTVMALKIFFSV
jgi:stage II sporulation protein E